MKYLDKDGLLYLWGKIKAKIPTKTSDLTNDSGYLTSHLTAGRSINITNNAINNTGVTDVSVSPNEAGNGTVAVTKGTATGTQTSYIKVKGISNGAYKDIDNTISAGSSSTNLPTSSAVASFVEGKGYIANETDPVFSASASAGITSSDIDNWDGKQDALVSGTNIKTINSQSIVGSGNVDFYGKELPIGTEVDYIGTTVPSGWQQVDDYSTDEINTGKLWIDGKPIYRKVVDFGTLPNATSKNFTHNISVDTVIKCYGVVYRASPYARWTIPTDNIYVYCNLENIIIQTTINRTDCTAKVILEYTKTTD